MRIARRSNAQTIGELLRKVRNDGLNPQIMPAGYVMEFKARPTKQKYAVDELTSATQLQTAEAWEEEAIVRDERALIGAVEDARSVRRSDAKDAAHDALWNVSAWSISRLEVVFSEDVSLRTD